MYIVILLQRSTIDNVYAALHGNCFATSFSDRVGWELGGRCLQKMFFFDLCCLASGVKLPFRF